MPNSIADDVLAKKGGRVAASIAALALLLAGGLFVGSAQNAHAAEGQEKPPAQQMVVRRPFRQV